MEWPFLEAVAFALTIAAALNHRSTGVSEISGQPLFSEHRDESGQQRHQETCVEKVRGCDDLRGGAVPRWGSGGIFVWEKGWVEGDEDCSEVGLGLVAGIWLKLGLEVNDECGADC